MNSKSQLVRQLWHFFVAQLVVGGCMIALLCMTSLIIYRNTNESLQIGIRGTTQFEQSLQSEQDPAKLRYEAKGLWNLALENWKTQKSVEILLIEVAAIFVTTFFVSSAGAGIFAYKFQRLFRAEHSVTG